MRKVNHGVPRRFLYQQVTLSWKVPRVEATADLSPVNLEFEQVVNRTGGKRQRESCPGRGADRGEDRTPGVKVSRPPPVSRSPGSISPKPGIIADHGQVAVDTEPKQQRERLLLRYPSTSPEEANSEIPRPLHTQEMYITSQARGVDQDANVEHPN